jgi:hypothetical protein
VVAWTSWLNNRIYGTRNTESAANTILRTKVSGEVEVVASLQVSRVPGLVVARIVATTVQARVGHL